MEPVKIFLAVDDIGDSGLFIDALTRIPLRTEVLRFENGFDLMSGLFSSKILPDVFSLI